MRPSFEATLAIACSPGPGHLDISDVVERRNEQMIPSFHKPLLRCFLTRRVLSCIRDFAMSTTYSVQAS